LNYGVHSLLWAERFDHQPERVISKVKALGFDGVEIFVTPEQIKTFDRKRVKEALRTENMKCLGSTTLDLKTDLTSADEQTRKNGINYLRDAAEMFSTFGANLLAGVVYVAWGKITGRGRTDEEWERSARSLKEICRTIRPFNVTLGLEPVNRFETYFLNTAADATKLAKGVDEPNIVVHLDTFHMNIEEKNYYDPIVNTGELLGHVHCCENDRGIAGTGNVNWDEVFKGLAEIGYDKWITLESFTPEIKSVAATTAIWRQLAPSADALASDGLKFLKSMENKYLRR